MAKTGSRYDVIIEDIFFSHYRRGQTKLVFERKEIEAAASKLKIRLPKNLGDLVYSFRYRTELPERIVQTAPEGMHWIIRPAGPSRYSFNLSAEAKIQPSALLAITKVLDSTPGIIEKYALNDEQALLAKIRYNRLVDTFTSLTCFSLQSHLRTTVPGMGQVETDEIYIGIDKRGVHYVLPVEAKAASDRVGVVQIEQDFAVCKAKFPEAIARPVAAQFIDPATIAMFEFGLGEQGVVITSEKHYKLVLPSDLSEEELREYQRRRG
jgi:hypothetical protein